MNLERHILCPSCGKEVKAVQVVTASTATQMAVEIDEKPFFARRTDGTFAKLYGHDWHYPVCKGRKRIGVMAVQPDGSEDGNNHDPAESLEDGEQIVLHDPEGLEP